MNANGYATGKVYKSSNGQIIVEIYNPRSGYLSFEMTRDCTIELINSLNLALKVLDNTPEKLVGSIESTGVGYEKPADRIGAKH
jgi:hypothetical protein